MKITPLSDRGTAVQKIADPGAMRVVSNATDHRNARSIKARSRPHERAPQQHRPQRQSAGLLASIVDSSQDAIVAKTLEGTITSWNLAAERMYGYTADEIIGKPISLLMPAGREEEMTTILDRIRHGERVEHYETDRLREDGSLFPVSLSVSPIHDVDGTLVGAASIARDITERRLADDQARAREASVGLLASIVDSSEDAIVGKSLDGLITSWNHAAEAMYGFAAEEVIGKPISMVMPRGGEDEMRVILERIRAGERVEHYETDRVRRDGSRFPVSLSVSPIRDSAGIVIGAASIGRDISERRLSDERLRAASNYARSLIEASLDPLVTISPEGKITDVNEATMKITGVAREALVGTDFSDYFTEPDEARAGYRRVFAEGSVTDYPLTIRHRDGLLTHVLYNASVYRDAAGEVLGVFAAARDVTAQKQAAQYARSLIEASLDPLVTISPEGIVTDVNEATMKATGVEREALVGTDFSDYFTEPDEARDGYQRVFAEGSVTDYPLTIRHRDGLLTHVLYNASVYRDAAGGVLGVFAAARDVTAQKRAEAEIAERRAKELDRLAELERFQRLTVGRELKMIELKKEIAELRAATTSPPRDAL